MPVNHGIQIIDIDKIVVPPRDERQRKELVNIPELMESIRKVGLINAIVIKRDRTLVAGERRFTAFSRLREAEPDNINWQKIPYKYLDELDEFEADIVELEENVKRVDLAWTDECVAIMTLHERYTSRSGEAAWTIEDTAKEVGYNVTSVSKALTVAKAIRENDASIVHCESTNAAYNILNRKIQRAVADELSNILKPKPFVPPEPTASEEPAAPTTTVTVQLPKREAPIVNADFLEWVESYTGDPFNLVHCDFPYGINHNKSKMGYAKAWGSYADSEEIYWHLCGALCANLDKIVAPSAHILFWFSMSYYAETLAFFKEHAPSLTVNSFPLIWCKNKGILPDATRGPRRSYETALFMTRGDRKILSPVHNFIVHNSEKDDHQSEKPVEMLRHYFRMVVDQNTTLFDPTCGSGSALRAAKSMGAKRVLGLELNPEFAENAINKFNLASMIKAEVQK